MCKLSKLKFHKHLQDKFGAVVTDAIMSQITVMGFFTRGSLTFDQYCDLCEILMDRVTPQHQAHITEY